MRLAIVGCGNICQLNALGYLEHPRCDVVALCDTDPKRAERRAHHWGIAIPGAPELKNMAGAVTLAISMSTGSLADPSPGTVEVPGPSLRACGVVGIRMPPSAGRRSAGLEAPLNWTMWRLVSGGQNRSNLLARRALGGAALSAAHPDAAAFSVKRRAYPERATLTKNYLLAGASAR